MHKLAVKLEGIERRKRTTGLFHIAAGFFLLLKSLDFFRLHGGGSFLAILPFFAVALLSLGYGVLKKLWDPAARFNRWVRLMQVTAFVVLAIEFVALGDTIAVVLLFAWAVGCLFLMFTERKVFHDAEMVFGNEGIYIPGYFTNRRLFWANIKDVVIRPDYITIFQRDDSFLQYEVLKKLDLAQLDEIALYCRRQIEAAATHQPKEF